MAPDIFPSLVPSSQKYMAVSCHLYKSKVNISPFMYHKLPIESSSENQIL